MRYASNIICPIKFNYNKYHNTIKQIFENIDLEIIKKEVENKIPNIQIRNQTSSIKFGEIVEYYFYDKYYKGCHKQFKIIYQDIIGRCDFLCNNEVVEIKYSTFIPTSKLIEIYKYQLYLYTYVLNQKKFSLIALNPIEDNVEICQDELKPEYVNIIKSIIDGNNLSFRIDLHCVYCDIKDCPVKKFLK
jgi:hypothetical protein